MKKSELKQLIKEVLEESGNGRPDGGVMQDLYHYALALQGLENGVDIYRLRERVD